MDGKEGIHAWTEIKEGLIYKCMKCREKEGTTELHECTYEDGLGYGIRMNVIAVQSARMNAKKEI